MARRLAKRSGLLYSKRKYDGEAVIAGPQDGTPATFSTAMTVAQLLKALRHRSELGLRIC